MTKRLNTDQGGVAVAFTSWVRQGVEKGTGQRFGQYLWNLYGAPGCSWPELFYCTESSDAFNMAVLECNKGDNE